MIKKLEKLLGINLEYIIKGGSYLLSSHTISIVLRLFLSIALARFLTKQVYGQYSFIFSIIGVVAIFALPGMTSATIRAVARGYEGTYLKIIKTKIKYALIGFFILVCVIIYFVFKNDLHLAKYLLIAAIFFIPQYCLLEYTNFFIGKKYFKKVAIFDIVTIAIYTTLTIVVAYLTRDLFWIILTLTGSISISYFIFFLISLKYKKNNQTKKGLIKYGKHLTLIEAIPLIGVHVDKLIITYFIGFEALAIYAIALIIPQQMRDVTKSIIPIFIPKFSELNPKEVYPKIRKKLLYLIILSIVFGLVMIILAPHLIPLIWSQKYIGSIYYAQLLIVATVVVLPTIVLMNLLKAQKKKKEIFKINIFITFLKIALMIILIPKFKLLGVVLSIFIYRIIGSIYAYYLTIKTFTSGSSR
tara:strand:- start:179 stop:1420 length:1242 start_codon:yes stop_codon:yes gene_type:complete